MLDRLSANILVKSSIAVLAAATMLLLALSAWDSWRRFSATAEMATVTEASSYAFKVLHNLRIDSTFTDRAFDAPGPVDAKVKQPIEAVRAAEMPALKSAVETLEGTSFPDGASLFPELQRLAKAMTTLVPATAAAFDKQKADRSPDLRKEWMTTTLALIDNLEKVSDSLTAAVKLQDPFIDQMMAIKQLAWTTRAAAGDAAVIISNGIISGHLEEGAEKKYTALISRVDTSWAALQDMAAGTTLPPLLAQAIATASGKDSFFAPDFIAARDKLLQQQLAGEKPDINLGQWAANSVARNGRALAVAEAALEAGKEHALALHAVAQRDLGLQLACLAVALALALGSFVAVSRRVIRPLHAVQNALLKVAGGDLTAEVSFRKRQDEIGALVDALGTFKQNSIEKARIEEEQRQRRAQADARQQATESHIKGFEGQIQTALAALGTASAQMSSTSEGISRTAEKSNHEVKAVAAASEEASTNVQTVAAASEELSASIAEIGQQVAHASSIAGRAVEETRETDGTVQSLAETASRIGEVVQLINAIAGQTNLLALNATIEAARAGEAGKGFAVVASEVKSLANQTAKATEDISTQIVAVQKVTKDAVEAIKRIGGTIGEVSTVATSIVAAMEEQGAATQEITRSTQQAARRTKEVSEHIVGVASGVDETGNAAQGVKAAAEALARQAEQLRAQVDDFLDKIRAG